IDDAPGFERAAPGGGRREVVAFDHVADVADAGISAERLCSSLYHLDAVVLLRIMRSGDLRPAAELIAYDGVVHHVGAKHPVIDDVRALFADALDKRGRQRR